MLAITFTSDKWFGLEGNTTTGQECEALSAITSAIHRASIHDLSIYSETSIHRFRRGSEKETMDPGKQ
jgi:hypothetical protein